PLLQVCQDVVDVLQAHGEPHQRGAHTGSPLLGLGELAVGGGGRVDDQRAHITDIGHHGVQLQRIDQGSAVLGSAVEFEGNDGSGTFGQVLLSALVVGAGGQAGIDDTRDGVVVLQIL